MQCYIGKVNQSNQSIILACDQKLTGSMFSLARVYHSHSHYSHYYYYYYYYYYYTILNYRVIVLPFSGPSTIQTRPSNYLTKQKPTFRS